MFMRPQCPVIASEDVADWLVFVLVLSGWECAVIGADKVLKVKGRIKHSCNKGLAKVYRMRRGEAVRWGDDLMAE